MAHETLLSEVVSVRQRFSRSVSLARDWGVLRGGSWGTAVPGELRLSYRNVVDRSERDVIFGFRCVLVPGPGS